MADSIEAAITSSIASHPDSDASTGAGGSSEAVVDTDTSTSDESGSTTTETAVSDAVVPDAAAAAVAAPAADAVSPASPADDSLETLKTELAGKRDNRIPYSRVTKIVENAEKKVRAELEAELAPYRTPDFTNQQQAMRVADERPEDFLTALSKVDPRYAALLEGSKLMGGGAAPGATTQRAAKTPQGSVEPDIQLADGTLGFSAEAVMRREEALAARMEEMFDTRLTDRMKDVSPLVEERRINTLREEAKGRVAKRIERAEKWAGFADNRDAIAARIMDANKRGETLSLEDAYIEVVVPKFRTDEASVRAKIHAEMNKAPAVTTRLAATNAGSKEEESARSDDDPITAAIKASIRKK